MKPALARHAGAHVNVVDTGLQARAARAVEAALKRRLTTVYATQDAAAKAWAAAVQPITHAFGVEVASRLYAMTGAIAGPARFGSPAVGREDCRRSYQCGVELGDAGLVPGGLLSGYVHTHPSDVLFSDNDLDKLVRLKVQAWSTPDVVAYVSVPSGRLYACSTRALTEKPQASWRDYVKRSVCEVR